MKKRLAILFACVLPAAMVPAGTAADINAKWAARREILENSRRNLKENMDFLSSVMPGPGCGTAMPRMPQNIVNNMNLNLGGGFNPAGMAGFNGGGINFGGMQPARPASPSQIFEKLTSALMADMGPQARAQCEQFMMNICMQCVQSGAFASKQMYSALADYCCQAAANISSQPNLSDDGKRVVMCFVLDGLNFACIADSEENCGEVQDSLRALFRKWEANGQRWLGQGNFGNTRRQLGL